jgi:hypothetical protein
LPFLAHLPIIMKILEALPACLTLRLSSDYARFLEERIFSTTFCCCIFFQVATTANLCGQTRRSNQRLRKPCYHARKVNTEPFPMRFSIANSLPKKSPLPVLETRQPSHSNNVLGSQCCNLLLSLKTSERCWRRRSKNLPFTGTRHWQLLKVCLIYVLVFRKFYVWAMVCLVVLRTLLLTRAWL